MAVQFNKDLKIKCIAKTEWIPKHINVKEWYPVVGVNTWQYKDNEQKIRTVVKFIVINDVLQVTQIADFNCQVLEQGEPDQEVEIPKDYEEGEEQPF